MKNIYLRYGAAQPIYTQLDPLEDLVAFLHAFGSQEFMEEAVRNHTGLSGGAEQQYAIEAASYVNVALNYLEQARRGSPRIAGLPLYYALLNLSKVYILLGPYRDELPGGTRTAPTGNKYHGLSYDPEQTSTTLLEEELQIKEKGVFSLLYKTLTTEPVPVTAIKLRSVYSRISDVGIEYELATGDKSQLLFCRVGTRRQNNASYTAVIVSSPSDASIASSSDNLKALIGFTRLDNGGSYRGPDVPDGTPDVDGELRKTLRTCLLYLTDGGGAHGDLGCVLPLSCPPLLLPEELPILLAHFHLSSVARYKPLLLDKLFNSRYSSLIIGLQRHGTLKFIMLLWSFVYKKNLLINPEPTT